MAAHEPAQRPPAQFPIKIKSSLNASPYAAAGVSIGCFAGAGYGLAVGIGNLRLVGRKNAVVLPSLSPVPFAHDGAILGAFCGVMCGVGFASTVAVHIGYQWQTVFARKKNVADLARQRIGVSMQQAFGWVRARQQWWVRQCRREEQSASSLIKAAT